MTSRKALTTSLSTKAGGSGKAMTNNSIIYDNIEKYYEKYSQFKKVVVPDLSKGVQRTGSVGNLLNSSGNNF
jgi:hypothetical protein